MNGARSRLRRFTLRVRAFLSDCAHGMGLPPPCVREEGTLAGTATGTNAEATAMNTFRSVGIVVSDIDRSIAFYRDVVGMQERRRFDVPAMHLLEVVMGFGAEGGGAAL